MSETCLFQFFEQCLAHSKQLLYTFVISENEDEEHEDNLTCARAWKFATLPFFINSSNNEAGFSYIVDSDNIKMTKAKTLSEENQSSGEDIRSDLCLRGNLLEWLTYICSLTDEVASPEYVANADASPKRNQKHRKKAHLSHTQLELQEKSTVGPSSLLLVQASEYAPREVSEVYEELASSRYCKWSKQTSSPSHNPDRGKQSQDTQSIGPRGRATQRNQHCIRERKTMKIQYPLLLWGMDDNGSELQIMFYHDDDIIIKGRKQKPQKVFTSSLVYFDKDLNQYFYGLCILKEIPGQPYTLIFLKRILDDDDNNSAKKEKVNLYRSSYSLSMDDQRMVAMVTSEVTAVILSQDFLQVYQKAKRINELS
ncbi:hypothetical protein MJT46_018608 [Ovis ammon polii x Ovis aries]|nr:hypothetical protein MJT46_018608 [Ovis ammon polii x Ovis aries]